MFLIRESLRLVWNFDELDAFKLSNPVYMGILGDPEPTFDTRTLNWGKDPSTGAVHRLRCDTDSWELG